MQARYSTLLIALTLFGCSADGQLPGDLVVRSEQVAQQPNIIFILVDDMGWGDAGYHGSEIATPNIDKLASSGVNIDRAYVYPICSPTRAALMTGRNPLQYGVDGPMENDAMLPLQIKLLPEFLREGGYRTWMVGKWHLGMGDVAAMPQSRGFDSFYGFLGGFIDYYTHVYFGGLDWQRDGKSLREEGYAMDLLTEEALRLIKTNDGTKPFFMYLSLNAPHTPLQYPPGADGTYDEIQDPDRRVFAQMLTHADISIGKVVAQLKASGIADNTIIVFMSDNGGLLEAGASNGTLRGGKGSAYEGGVRVPASINWPSVLKPRKMADRPFFVQDWLPTLLDAAKVTYDSKAFDGVSGWRAIKGQAAALPRDPVILGTVHSKAVYQWPYKMVRNGATGADGKDQLFNVAADPDEKNDISAANSGLTKKLAAKIDVLPKRPSKGAKGPPPESLFKDTDGKFNHAIRMPETRKPWAEAGTAVLNGYRTGSEEK